MNQRMGASVPGFSISELRAALEQVLSRHFGRQRSVIRLDHRPSAYGSSSALEELQVSLDDGTMLQVMFKDLSRQSLLETARRVKPAFLHDPVREIETYRTILAPQGLDSATYYGAVVDAALGRYWLFLEKVPGVELYQVGDVTVWRKAAVWLADLHTRFARKEARQDLASAAHLLIYDREYYLLWMRRAREFLAAAQHWQRKGPNTIPWLSERYGRVVERLLSLPLTVFHGEFYASNVLVRERHDTVRICPVDWEMAAVGPGLMDVAALTAGAWSDAERTSLAMAYHAALPPDGSRPSQEALLTALDWCRLHLAVRWLGWSPGWSPPPEHAQDWLGEALRLAEKLDL